MSAPCPVLGFIVSMHLESSLADSGRSGLWNAWIDLMEAHGLQCGGGGDQIMEYVVSSEAAQATEADRVAITRWLTDRTELTEWTVGPVIDLNPAA